MASSNNIRRLNNYLKVYVFIKLLTFQSTDSCRERVLFPAWDVLASLV